MEPLLDRERSTIDRPAARPRAVRRSPAGPAGRHGASPTTVAVAQGAQFTAADVSEAVESERARTRAWLHDTVLQVLELLAAGGYADEPDPHHMAAMAARAADELRAEIEGELRWAPETLIEQIHAVAAGERVLALHEIRVQPGVIESLPIVPGSAKLAAAAAEALRNARKHAGATRVTVSCEIVDGLATVVVADDGTGFDRAKVDRGTGLRQSIVGRLESEGGRALIDTYPGGGTRVLLQLRLAPAGVARAAEGLRP
jgi:signal transduction histidine kinase